MFMVTQDIRSSISGYWGKLMQQFGNDKYVVARVLPGGCYCIAERLSFPILGS